MGFWKKIKSDLKAFMKNDPAAKSRLEIVLSYNTFHAILLHRFTHPLYKLGIPILPRFVSNINRFLTGVEIHPGAEIGESFFMDHGTATVIGETVKIGKNCTLFHNVTLGGTGKHSGKRHPTLGDNVYVGTGATILGPVKIGDNVMIGAETFIIMHDVPNNCTVVGVPAKIVKMNGKKINKKLLKTTQRQ